MTFGVISFHLVDAGLLTAALVPVVYAGAMGLEALAALATGFAYDRWEYRVLLVLPVLVALVPPLAFAGTLGLALLGVAAWGFAAGIQDSTVKALVADLVPQRRLATAYGVFAAFQGIAALAGGTLAGGLYTGHHVLLADLVPASGLATAYGVFAAFQGGAALAGGVLAGGLYRNHLGLLIAVVALLQALSLGLLLLTPRLRTAVAA
jgi:MFS family permease